MDTWRLAPCLLTLGEAGGKYGTPSDRTLKHGKGGAWRCVSLGSVYVAARVGAVCLLACVIACGLCEVPGGGQLRLALVCGWALPECATAAMAAATSRSARSLTVAAAKAMAGVFFEAPPLCCPWPAAAPAAAYCSFAAAIACSLDDCRRRKRKSPGVSGKCQGRGSRP